MHKPDVNALAQKMIDATRAFVTRSESAINKRIDAVEARLAAIPASPKGEKGDPGESIKGNDGVDGAAGARGEPGPAVDLLVVKAMVGDEVARAVVSIQKPTDGKDGVKGDTGERGPAGKDMTVEQINPLIVQEVERVVSALPKPKDGVPGADGESGKDGEQGERGPIGLQGDAGKDGRDADMVVVADMVCVTVKEAIAQLPAPKDGADGRDGKDGASVHPDTIALMVAEQVAKAIAMIPRAVDGAPGRDAAELTVLPGIDEARSYPAGTYAKHNGGEIRASRRTDPVKDGDLLAAGWTIARDGIAAIVVTQGEDPRQIEVAAMLTSRAKAISAFRMPAMIYREVWRDGEYDNGDVVTWGGSAWHCQQKTTDKPGTSAAWRMMVKEGRPGKDAGVSSKQAGEPVVRLK